MQEYLLKTSSITKEFSQGNSILKVLQGLDLEIAKQDAICITGPSGAGKSTFLHILGTLDRPTSGSVFYKNKNLSTADSNDKAQFRREKLGFVFQFHYLLQEFNMIENIMVAGQIGGMSSQEAKENALYFIKLLELEQRQNHFPSELSGGEQQRTAVARALMNKPEVLLMDEPTGNLDTRNSMRILDIIFELRQRLGLTLVAVSHDSHFSKSFPKILEMKDGQWVS